MKDLILKNSEWLRGQTSLLLRVGDDKKCCLGVLSVQEGVNPHLIKGVGNLSHLTAAMCQDTTFIPASIFWLIRNAKTEEDPRWFNSHDALLLMSINDNPNTTDDEKVESMRPIFESHGFNVVYKADE